MGDSTSMWRSLAIGAFVGVLGVAGLTMWGVRASRTAAQPPRDLLVVALTRDVDDAVVAGVVFATRGSGDAEDVQFVDTAAKVTIPGTSYDTLKDSYSFGGGQAVLDAVATLQGTDAGIASIPQAWVVLPDATWMELVNEAGGVMVEVPTDMNAFVEGELHVFERGRQRVGGEELFALASSVAFLKDPADASALQQAVDLGIAQAVDASWQDVADAVALGASSSSVSSRALESFAARADTP